MKTLLLSIYRVLEVPHMPRYGFIHDRLDIKILILYIAARLPGSVPLETLTDLIMCDDGVDYFEFMTCLDDLVRTGHMELVSGTKYTITQKGLDAEAAAASSIAYSVRMKVNKNVIPYVEQLRRDALVKTEHSARADGTCTVSLSLSDDSGAIFNLEMLSPDEDSAKKIERNFKLNAEQLYHSVYEVLCSNSEKHG